MKATIKNSKELLNLSKARLLFPLFNFGGMSKFCEKKVNISEKRTTSEGKIYYKILEDSGEWNWGSWMFNDSFIELE